MKKNPWKRVCLYLFVFAVCVIILYPYFVMFTTAAKTNEEMYSTTAGILPKEFKWSNFIDVWSAAPIMKYMFNSIIVAGGATLIAILCGIPAAYALSRMKFKGKGFFMGAVIMSQMFSPVVLLVGINRMMSSIGLKDSLLGLILLNAAFNQAFAIWLLRGTFTSISSEMEQAAKIDGCGAFRTYWNIILPLTKTGLATLTVLTFNAVWNDYMGPMLYLDSDSLRTIQVALASFKSQYSADYASIMAGTVCSLIPIVVVYACAQKYIVEGVAFAGVKG